MTMTIHNDSFSVSGWRVQLVAVHGGALPLFKATASRKDSQGTRFIYGAEGNQPRTAIIALAREARAKRCHKFATALHRDAATRFA